MAPGGLTSYSYTSNSQAGGAAYFPNGFVSLGPVSMDGGAITTNGSGQLDTSNYLSTGGGNFLARSTGTVNAVGYISSSVGFYSNNGTSNALLPLGFNAVGGAVTVNSAGNFAVGLGSSYLYVDATSGICSISHLYQLNSDDGNFQSDGTGAVTIVQAGTTNTINTNGFTTSAAFTNNTFFTGPSTVGFFGVSPNNQQANTVGAATALRTFGFIASGGTLYGDLPQSDIQNALSGVTITTSTITTVAQAVTALNALITALGMTHN